MTRRSVLCLAVAVGIAASASCGGPPPAPRAPQPAPADAALPVVPGKFTSTVTLPPLIATVTSVGAAPRSRLRYVLTPGAAQIVERTIGTSVEATINAQPAPSSEPVPTQVLGGVFEVRATERGATTMHVTIDRATSGDGGVASEIIGFVGTTLVHPIDGRGQAGTLEVRSSMEDDAHADAIAGVIHTRSRPIVLPSEPIAVGGTWTVVGDDVVSGIRSTVTTTYTLVARTGDVVTLRGTITSVAGPQRVASPTGEVRVASVTGGGTLDATVDLRHPIPTLSTSERYDARMTTNGVEIRMVSTVTSRQTARPR